jgi:hypothetical protein
MNVRLSVIIGPDGDCIVVGIGPDSGIPDTFTFTKGEVHDPKKHRCDVVPQSQGSFRASVAPASSQPDLRLSQMARDKAAVALRYWRSPGCRAYFPIVYGGDPAFHVYITCAGLLQSIEEFEIRGGIPADTPRGYRVFETRRASLEQESRPRNKSLWIGSATIGP